MNKIEPQIVSESLIKQVADAQSLSLDDTSFAIKYINYYCQDPKDGQLTDELIEGHVISIQKMIGLPVTGKLDTKIIKAMQHIPRCGVPDYIKFSKMGAGSGPKWGISNLNYYIDKYVAGLSQSDQSDLVKLAFRQWSDVANIKFTQVSSSSNAQLVISTGRGRSDNFDGPGNTLAWAYLPPNNNYKGQLLMRFDLDETWITNSSDRGILFLNVATHEFGHMLGLDHSNVQRALMAPYYAVNITKPQPQDDIPRIQSLYGASAPTPTPTPTGKYKLEITVSDLSQVTVNGKAINNFMLITPN